MSSKTNFTAKGPGPKPDANVRRRASAICVRGTGADAEVLMVVLKDPASGQIFRTPPGGGIEPSETPAGAAIRECFEETGYRVKVLAPAEIARYDFPWNGRIHHCETYFFICELAGLQHRPEKVQDADYNLGTEWIKLSAIESTLDRELKNPVLRAAILDALKPRSH
jgi:8-oxo-dGTP pyrophosphatase MutT (NUDIX family)